MKENETKTQSKAVRVIKAIINTIINVLIVIVLVTSILIAVMALTSKSSGISTILGYTIQPIQSDSMKGGSEDFDGGDFEHGDLMIAKATGFDENKEYRVGDIVTYRTEDTNGNDVLVVHRIVNTATAPDGYPSYQTWGDNREVSEVPDQLSEKDYIRAFDIGSIFYSESNKDDNGFIIKGAGNIIDFLRTQTGFFFAVLLPMIIFFMYALVRVVLSATGYKKAKAEEEKDEAVKEAVAAALASKEGDTAQAADTASAAAMSAEELEQFRQFQEFQKMQKAQQEQAADPNTEE